MEFVFKISLASYSFSLKQKNSSVKLIKLLVISITLFVISLITGKTKTNNGI